MKVEDKQKYVSELKEIILRLNIDKLISSPDQSITDQGILRAKAIFTNFDHGTGEKLEVLVDEFLEVARPGKRIDHIRNLASDIKNFIIKKTEEMDVYNIEAEPKEIFTENIIKQPTFSEIQESAEQGNMILRGHYHQEELQRKAFKQQRILNSENDKRIHALNIIAEHIGPYYPKQKNINIDYYYFNYEDRMVDSKLFEKFLEETKKEAVFKDFVRTNYAGGTRFGFININIENLNKFKEKLKEKLHTSSKGLEDVGVRAKNLVVINNPQNIKKMKVTAGDKKNNFNRLSATSLWKIISLATLIVAIISIPWWPGIIDFFQKNTSDFPKDNINFSTSTTNLQSNSLLRALEPLETGKKIGDLPNGVYFFASPLLIVYEIEDPKNDFLEATNKRFSNHSFEIQKIENRYYLIGFISDEAYSNIGSINSQNSIVTILFPNRWEGAAHPVAIPFDAINTIKDRSIDLDEKTKADIFDIRFQEVKDNPEVH